jgi:hypothetical protein
MSKTGPAHMQNTYAEQAISIRELAAQVKSSEVRAQLLQIAILNEKLSDLLREAAVRSLTTMAVTLHGDLFIHPGTSLIECPRVERS